MYGANSQKIDRWIDWSSSRSLHKMISDSVCTIPNDFLGFGLEKLGLLL